MKLPSTSRQGLDVLTSSHTKELSFDPNGAPPYQADPEMLVAMQGGWFCGFLQMALFFGLNHGTVTAVLAIASSNFNFGLVAVSSMCLNIFYTISSLLIAVPIIETFGAKKTLVIGASAYVIYVATFALLVLFPDLSMTARYIIVVAGSSLGGGGAGVYWTGQGAYFAQISSLHAKATGQKPEDVNGFFAGLFATCYVGGEVLCKMFSSIVQDSWKSGGKTFVFVAYAVLAMIGAIGMTTIRVLPKKEQIGPKPSCCALMGKKLQAISTVLIDPKIWLIAPINFSFNFAASFLGQYVSGKIARATISASNVGLLSSIIPGYAAFAGIPYGLIGNVIGKMPMMVLGCSSFFAIGLILSIVSASKIEAAGLGALIGIYLIMGNGRAVYESTYKAVIADFFPERKAGAFAIFGVQGGLAGAMGYLVFAPFVNIDPVTAANILTGMGAVAMLLAPIAFLVNDREKRKKMYNEALLSEFKTTI